MGESDEETTDDIESLIKQIEECFTDELEELSKDEVKTLIEGFKDLQKKMEEKVETLIEGLEDLQEKMEEKEKKRNNFDSARVDELTEQQCTLELNLQRETIKGQAEEILETMMLDIQQLTPIIQVQKEPEQNYFKKIQILSQQLEYFSQRYHDNMKKIEELYHPQQPGTSTVVERAHTLHKNLRNKVNYLKWCAMLLGAKMQKTSQQLKLQLKEDENEGKKNIEAITQKIRAIQPSATYRTLQEETTKDEPGLSMVISVVLTS